MSRFGLERPVDLFASTLHRCMCLPSEEVSAARVLFPSVLDRKDPVRMVMISFAVRLNFVSGDVVNAKSHVFALYHVNIIVRMQRTQLRDMGIDVVACVLKESCCACL